MRARRLPEPRLVLLAAAALLSAAAAAADQSERAVEAATRVLDGAGERADRICTDYIVAVDEAAATTLHGICHGQRGGNCTSLPASACRREYMGMTGVRGAAGCFSKSDLDMLIACLGGGVVYVERDYQVWKAEGPNPQVQLRQPPPAPIARRGGRRAQKLRPILRAAGGRDWRFRRNHRSLLTHESSWNNYLPVESKDDEEREKAAEGVDEWLKEDKKANSGSSPSASAPSSSAPLTPPPPASAPQSVLASQGGREGASRAHVQSLHPALWALDRIDQRLLPLDRRFAFGSERGNATGKGVTIYTVDSGIIPTHQEFQPWSSQPWGSTGSRAYYGRDFVDDDTTPEDCDGHGTHVAATAVGRSVGIAKEAKVVAVRVLNCQGSGSISDVVMGLEWVANNHVKPAIVTLSLGIAVGSWSRALETAVRALILDFGITVVVASGNSAVDSCYVAPANVPECITVSASTLETRFRRTSAVDVEGIYRWSNTGSCIDIFAPGVDIYSACGGSRRCQRVTDTAYTWASGTSMAVPHVAGAAAAYLQTNPTASPREVKQMILGGTTEGLLESPYLISGTPNRLLCTKDDI